MTTCWVLYYIWNFIIYLTAPGTAGQPPVLPRPLAFIAQAQEPAKAGGNIVAGEHGARYIRLVSGPASWLSRSRTQMITSM